MFQMKDWYIEELVPLLQRSGGKMIKFGELRTYISRIDRVSICMQETLHYENYRFIRQVPESYNEYLVYGIGMIESEFLIKEAIEPEVQGNKINDDEFLAPCIEIRLVNIINDNKIKKQKERIEMRKTKLEQKIDQLIEEKSLCVDLDNREWYKQCMKMGIPFFQAAHKVFIEPAEAAVCFRSESEKEKDRLEASDRNVPDREMLSDQFEWIFTRVKAAINDREQECANRDRSYSRSIIVPLFKYGKHTSRLVVKKLCLNTIKLRVQITYLNDPGSRRELYVNVPFLEINHVEKIKESIWRELKAEAGSEKSFPDMEDEIDIDADIVGFTLDAAALKKDQMLRLAYTQEEIGWHRSYRTDREVISSEKLWCKEEIRSDAATQLARYLVIYCLCDDMASINKLLAVYEAEDMTEGFEYNVYEKWAFRQIHAYLLKESDNVRKDWIRLFGKKDGTCKDYFVVGGSGTKIDRQMAMELMERLRKNGQLLSDDRLYHRVMEITKSM